MANIQVFHTTNIILSDTSRFTFIRSIPETILRNVTTASEIIRAYRSLPASGPRPMTSEVRKVLEEADKPNKGGKRKPKVGPSEPAQTPKKKVKQAACKPKTPTPSDEEDSISNTVSYIRSPERVEHKHDDTTTTSQPIVSQPTPTTKNPEVTFTMPTSVLISDDFFQDFTLPSPTATTTPITIAPCPPVSVEFTCLNYVCVCLVYQLGFMVVLTSKLPVMNVNMFFCLGISLGFKPVGRHK